VAKEVWEQIQAAEAEARQMIEGAKQQSVQALANARQEAIVIIRKAEEQAKNEGEAFLKQKLAEFETTKQKRLDQIDSEIRDLISRSEKRIPGATKNLVEKVVS